MRKRTTQQPSKEQREGVEFFEAEGVYKAEIFDLRATQTGNLSMIVRVTYTVEGPECKGLRRVMCTSDRGSREAPWLEDLAQKHNIAEEDFRGFDKSDHRLKGTPVEVKVTAKDVGNKTFFNPRVT